MSGVGDLSRYHHNESAFTLIELSVVLVIIAFVLGGALTVGLSAIQRKPYEETYAKLATIEKHLLLFRNAFQRLPCPAIIGAVPSAANFGKEVAPVGTCPGTLGVGDLVGGAIPTKILRLPDIYAFDGWGRRFTYWVDKRTTDRDVTSGKGALVDIALADSVIGTIQVNDVAGSVRTTRGVYAIISHGKNGHGAYPYQGGGTVVNATAGNIGVGARELENCGCDASGAATPPNTLFYQQGITEDGVTATENFDDIVAFKTRQTLRGSDE